MKKNNQSLNQRNNSNRNSQLSPNPTRSWKKSSLPNPIPRSRSLIINNPLTRSYFSLNDTSLNQKPFYEKKPSEKLKKCASEAFKSLRTPARYPLKHKNSSILEQS